MGLLLEKRTIRAFIAASLKEVCTLSFSKNFKKVTKTSL